jgi:hypothetical protein
VRVFDPTLPNHPTLVSTRTIEPSPWAANEVFTGGYDGAANSRANHNTAWIFRGQWARVKGTASPTTIATSTAVPTAMPTEAGPGREVIHLPLVQRLGGIQ